MRNKLAIFIMGTLALAACDKHDPILPGVRDDIFNTKTLNILNENVPDAPENIATIEPVDCQYTQKSDNTIWNGERKIFSGFATGNSVAGTRKPVCNGKYVYAGGLGDAFCKISVATGNAAWCVDIGVEKPFIITDTVAYVVDTENMIDAVRLRDGAIHWRAAVKKSRTPKYENKTIIVGDEKFNAESGEKISG